MVDSKKQLFFMIPTSSFRPPTVRFVVPTASSYPGNSQAESLCCSNAKDQKPELPAERVSAEIGTASDQIFGYGGFPKMVGFPNKSMGFFY